MIQSDSTTLEILTQVNNFYNTAWTRLVGHLTLIVLLISIAIPLLYAAWQYFTFRRSIKLAKTNILALVNRQMRREIHRLNATYTARINELNNRIENTDNWSKGWAAHMQGVALLQNDRRESAFSEFVDATYYFLLADKVGNADIALMNIARICLPTITRERLMEISTYREHTIFEVIGMAKVGNYRRLDGVIAEIEVLTGGIPLPSNAEPMPQTEPEE